MKIRTAFACLFLVSAAGAAHAADNRIVFGPLTTCEKQVVDYCERYYSDPAKKAQYDTCINDGFDDCNSKSALAVRGTVNLGIRNGTLTTEPAPKSPAKKAPLNRTYNRAQ